MQKRKKENIYHWTERIHENSTVGFYIYCITDFSSAWYIFHLRWKILQMYVVKIKRFEKRCENKEIWVLQFAVWLCDFFFVPALSQIKKLSYSINLYQLVLMLAISSTARKDRGNNSLRHLFPNVWLGMVQRVCSPTLQEEVLSLNNTNPLYMILHLLFSVETTFIQFSPQCFWATAAEE